MFERRQRAARLSPMRSNQENDASNEETGALPPQAVAVQAALVAAGVRGEVRRLDESARTAAEAAAALGVEVGQIANSLVFVADGEPLLVLTSGRHRVDTAKVAALLGVSNVGRADADFVRTHTGISIGGVSPIGHPTPLRTLVALSQCPCALQIITVLSTVIIGAASAPAAHSTNSATSSTPLYCMVFIPPRTSAWSSN